MEKFEKLGLGKETLDVLKELKITVPTEIQEKTIPLALAGKDIIAGSATGSGKTLAFASAIIEKLKKGQNPQAIILTPTRELAEQVSNAIKEFSRERLFVLPIYGGVNMDAQIRNISRADVIVGTPGRILDHLNRATLELHDIKILVLDEFDRMLDMGFHKDVGKIIDVCPNKRQTMLFSATISSDIDFLSQRYTQNPIEISVQSHVDHSKLKQIYYDTPNNLKFSLLVHLLNKEKSGLVMIFCSTRRNADFVTANLNQLHIEAKAIHGGMEQNKRMKTLKLFHGTGANILVCTDVAARGLDIKGVSHVYNYDLPKTSDEYIHRIGRTARAGKNGIAINILSSRDYEAFSDISNNTKFDIEEIKLPKLDLIRVKTDIGRNGRQKNNTRERGFNRGRRDSRSGSRSRDSGRSFGRNSRVEMFDAVCSKCKKKCQVPFKPTNGKPISCSNCFVKKDSKGGRNSRSRNFKNNTRGKSFERGRSDSGNRDSRNNFSKGKGPRKNNFGNRR